MSKVKYKKYVSKSRRLIIYVFQRFCMIAFIVLLMMLAGAAAGIFSKKISILIIILFMLNIFITAGLCDNTDLEDAENEKKFSNFERCDKE